MFSFNNGILRISSDRLGLDLFIDASFFILLSSLFSATNVEGSNYFYYVAFFLFFGLTFIKLLMSLKTHGGLNIPSFTLWYGGFVLLSLASVLWAQYPDNSMRVISRMLQSTVITFCVAQNYATRKGLLRCIRIFAWTGTCMALYMLANTPVNKWFDGFFGSSATHQNTNTLGMLFTLCVMVSFYFAFYCNEKRYYAITVLQMLIVILTSSRKSLLASVAGLAMMAMLKVQRRNIVFRIFTISGFVLAVYYLIMSVPELYSAIGVRMESMTEHLMGDGGDFSISLRQLFIDNAKDMFYEKPLLGYGINNFVALIYRRIGISSYAHNNYYEILADLGIVGFIVFYGYYFFLLFTLLKIWRNRNGSLVKLMLVWLAVIMICEYGMISYYSIYMQIALCCIYMLTCAVDKEDDYTDGTPSYLKYKHSVYG